MAMKMQCKLFFFFKISAGKDQIEDEDVGRITEECCILQRGVGIWYGGG